MERKGERDERRKGREKERAPPRWTRCLSSAINVYNSKGGKKERKRKKEEGGKKKEGNSTPCTRNRDGGR